MKTIKLNFKIAVVLLVMLVQMGASHSVVGQTEIVSQDASVGETVEEREARMAWWTEATFGMFIHWGLYAIPAGRWGDVTTHGEWIMLRGDISRAEYSKFADQFNPTEFNAEEWVQLAKDAGQKYVVITAKHHDGFAMFDSEACDYNVVDATPFKRDVIKEMAEACRKLDMKLGFYYSQAQDWYHPGGGVSRNIEFDSTHIGDMDQYIEEIAVPQVKELLANYGDVAVLWWDTPIKMTTERAQKLDDLLKPYPHIITNNRLGGGILGDLTTPEQYIPPTGYPGENWEVCMTMNGNWGYNAYNEQWKSTEELLQRLIDIVSKGGNFLLNVGPNSSGVIPEVCQQNLREMGDWLKINGESIYGATSSPFPFLSWGRATQKGQKLYLHVFDWPEDGKLLVPLANKITKTYLLADTETNLKVASGKGKSTIILPNYAPDKMASVVVVEFKGEPIVLPAPSSSATISASSTAKDSPISNVNDGDPRSTWLAEKGETSAMVEIDLGEPVSIQSISLVEPYYPWSHLEQKQELQFQEGSTWKTIFTSESNGTGLTRPFTPVTAQKFRLILQNETEVPGLHELILFRAD